jgi:hypothetical protein
VAVDVRHGAGRVRRHGGAGQPVAQGVPVPGEDADNRLRHRIRRVAGPRARGDVEDPDAPQRIDYEGPAPAGVAAGDEHPIGGPAHAQPLELSVRRGDVVEDQATGDPGRQRELGNAVSGRQRVAGRHPRVLHVEVRKDQPEALYELRERQVTGPVIGDHVSERRQPAGSRRAVRASAGHM